MNRRSFLGALLVAIPGVKALAAMVPMRQCEISIQASDWPRLIFTLFTDKSWKATWGGTPCDVRAEGSWNVVTCRRGESLCESMMRWDGDVLELWHFKMQSKNGVVEASDGVEKSFRSLLL